MPIRTITTPCQNLLERFSVGAALRFAGHVRREERPPSTISSKHRSGRRADPRNRLRRSAFGRAGLLRWRSSIRRPTACRQQLPMPIASSSRLSMPGGGFCCPPISSRPVWTTCWPRNRVTATCCWSRTTAASLPCRGSLRRGHADYAVFSADHRYDTSDVEAIYARRGRVLHTADTGAVTARIDAHGLRVETFVKQ